MEAAFSMMPGHKLNFNLLIDVNYISIRRLCTKRASTMVFVSRKLLFVSRYSKILARQVYVPIKILDFVKDHFCHYG